MGRQTSPVLSLGKSGCANKTDNFSQQIIQFRTLLLFAFGRRVAEGQKKSKRPPRPQTHTRSQREHQQDSSSNSSSNSSSMMAKEVGGREERRGKTPGEDLMAFLSGKQKCF